jgi:large conductance mechanosensitive channel
MEAPLKQAGSLWAEFKKFAMQGNMIDLAVGVVIGAAFGKVVTSLVTDIIMPPLGYAMGGVDFSNKYITIKQGVWDAAKNIWTTNPVQVRYGVFINNIIDFLIVAASIFVVVKLISMGKHAPPAPAGEPTTKECPMCLSTIPIKARRCAHCCAEIGIA